MDPVLVGIDIGTTHIKAAAFTPRGRLIQVTRVPTPTLRPSQGRAEYDPEAVWGAVRTCLLELPGQLRASVTSVGIASMAEAGLLVGPAGDTPHPAIAWFDMRTTEQARHLMREIGAERLHAQTGLRVQPKHGLSKILWFQQHHPEWISPGYTWLSMAEYIAFRLTGMRRSCPSLAARTLAYDIATGTWSTDLIGTLGLPAELFPPLVPEGESLGGISSTVATECGLPEDTPVALAGHDHPCAALATGVVGPGRLLISTGTAETLLGVIGSPRLTPEVFASNISQGPLPIPNTITLQASIPSSGASFEWVRRELLSGLSYGEIEELAGSGTPGPSGLLFLPHVNGAGAPIPDPTSRGALLGLTSHTPRSSIARAIFEGASFELRRLFTTFEGLVDAPFETIYVTGGHVQNQTWMQLKADILARTLTVPDVPEATLLGAALLGGTAAGVFSDPVSAALSVQRQERMITPRDEVTTAYQGFYRVYEEIYPALRPLFSAWPQAQ